MCGSSEGVTSAIVNCDANVPDDRDRFTISLMDGSRQWIFCLSNQVGRGSSWHDFVAD